MDGVKNVKKKVKLSPCVIKHRSMKACGQGVDVWFHVFLISVLWR